MEAPACCLLSLEKFNAVARKSHKYIGKYLTRFEMRRAGAAESRSNFPAHHQDLQRERMLRDSTEMLTQT